jgi:hypothetical protein
MRIKIFSLVQYLPSLHPSSRTYGRICFKKTRKWRKTRIREIQTLIEDEEIGNHRITVKGQCKMTNVCQE